MTHKEWCFKIQCGRADCVMCRKSWRAALRYADVGRTTHNIRKPKRVKRNTGRTASAVR